jgi:site-specific DNA-methyltransferase (adenine-specific)
MSLPEDFAGLTPESARRCQLIHGDCLEKLAEIPEKSIDLILTDLPSGVSGLYWDQPIDLGRLWSHYRRLIRPNGPIVLFASQPYATDLVVGNREWLKYELIWEKDHKTGFVHAKNKPLRAHENILVFSEGATFHEGHTNRRMPFFPQGVVPNTQKLVTYSNGRQKSAGFKSGYRKPNIWEHTGYPNTILKFSSDRLCLHPVEKPIALLEYLIRTYCPDDGMVLDSAMGGGSTGIAAANTGRRFIGIEKDAEFFRIAAEVLSVSGRESA